MPDPGFGPPRHGAHHDAQPDHGGVPPVTDGASRDERLAGFAAGGEWESCPPSAQLAAVLQAVSGAQWRCPGATDDEMIGMVRRWAAIESWASAARLGVIRELIRREDKPWLPTDQHADLPDAWSESLTHELALALASSAGSADRTAWLAWELERRLPGIGALLADGILTYGKAKAVAEAFKHLSDADAAHAEALILAQLAGKTYLQVLRLATTAASRVDPEGDERRRKEAERQAARVRLWREQSGAAALAGFDLPADEALAAHANVSARAEQYKKSEAFPDAQLDQLRAMAYLDLLNGITAEVRIGQARASAAAASLADPAGSGAAQETPDDAPGRDQGGSDTGEGGPDGGADQDGDGPASGGPEWDGPDGGRPDNLGGPGGRGPDSGQPAGPALEPITRKTDLVIPLGTLLGLANRPGEGHGFGPIDPALCRGLAATAANSAASEFCVTVTDIDGIAIGHGCGRTRRSARWQATRRHQERGSIQGRSFEVSSTAALPARVNLTISLSDLQGLTDSASRCSPWDFTRADDTGPPGGCGTWTLTIPGDREFTVRLEPVPTFGCDHRHESHAYQANGTLRHLIQVRDGDCTFPPCTRHARECDFEHAVPYDRGGRTCACNAGARSRKCHRIKQSAGWNVTQPQPGFHEWTTPTGRTYTQEPKRYPA